MPLKILYGICGLGNGHAMRQLPLLEELAARDTNLFLFAYSQSHTFFKPWAEARRIPLAEVAVPFTVTTAEGVDEEATRTHPANLNRNFAIPNAAAHAAVTHHFGRPDLVITDYEPISAQFAYQHNVPLITLDQQSKFLLTGNTLPPTLNGFSPTEEITRLRHFFPHATHRLACSFFKVEGTGTNVTIIPPTLRPCIQNLMLKSAKNPTFTVYITGTNGSLELSSLTQTLATFPSVRFNVFTRANLGALPPHITLHQPEESTFLQSLSISHGIITSAGHSLLSEAMFLGLPVLAIPTAIYEQHLNATIIQQEGAGEAALALTPTLLEKFIDTTSAYKHNIASSSNLLRTNGTLTALHHILSR